MRTAKYLSVAIAMALAPSAAQATVLTFEDLSGSGAVPANYGGINWNTGWSHYDFSQQPYTPSSGVQRIYYNGNDASFTFMNDVAFNGFFASGQSNPLGYDLYNDGSLVASISAVTLSNNPFYLASGYNGLIDTVTLRGTNGFFVVDDVTFNSQVQAVPEPATWAMMLLGFGFVGGAMRSRRRQKLTASYA